MNKKILFLSADTGDYLNISLLHGFKSLINIEVVDYPKSYVSYKEYKNELIHKVRGNGFTLFFNLNEDNVNRFHLKFQELPHDEFDLIIFGDIQSTYGYYLEYYDFLNPNSVVFLDGSDAPHLFGNSGFFWRKLFLHLAPKPQHRFLYFKRELVEEELNYSRFYKLLPKSVVKHFPLNKNLRKISFSIPEEKIIKSPPQKIKMFTSHIVDEEIVKNMEGGKSTYLFTSEEEYYKDIQDSKYGITTKRAGWDCLRHYEIAANGAVLCFKDLDKKPKYCAPHDLVIGHNCISYSSYDDLMNQINSISEEKYCFLQEESLKWVKTKTTVNMAKYILKEQDKYLNK